MKLGNWIRNFGMMYPEEREFLMEHKTKDCVVCVSEDYHDFKYEIFEYEHHYKGKNPATTKVLIKTDRGYFIVIRYNADRKVKVTRLEPALLHFGMTFHQKMIYKDEELYKEFMGVLILDKI